MLCRSMYTFHWCDIWSKEYQFSLVFVSFRSCFMQCNEENVVFYLWNLHVKKIFVQEVAQQPLSWVFINIVYIHIIWKFSYIYWLVKHHIGYSWRNIPLLWLLIFYLKIYFSWLISACTGQICLKINWMAVLVFHIALNVCVECR